MTGTSVQSGGSLAPFQPASSPAHLPTEVGSRIRAIDALRGVALLGIGLANVRQFFLPWDVADFPVPIGAGERAAWLDWAFFHAFVDLKFLTLFSVLFGASFVLQADRLTARDANFGRIYLRRVAILALFGVAHGLLLYPAEVLTPYAVAGLILLTMRSTSATTLLRAGLVLLGFSTLVAFQLGALGQFDLIVTALVLGLMIAAFAGPWRRRWPIAVGLWAAVVVGGGAALTARVTVQPDSSPAAEYREARAQLDSMRGAEISRYPHELRVRREGDSAGILRLHASQYGLVLLYFAVLLLWRTLGLFMIGAGLVRAGLLTRAPPELWKRVARLGLGLGIPISAVATFAHRRDILGLSDWRFPEFLHAIGALILAAGIAGIVFLFANGESLRWLWARVEAAGRMPLTNYVGQSLILAALAEPWGLDFYGRVGGPALTAIAVAVFAMLAAASYAWLRRFHMGPLEWVWRCGTYGRWLPNR